jgi:phage minor structural protein
VGLFRVYEIRDRIGYNEETTYYLEHAIATLEDSLAIGQQSINAPPATTFATLLETQNERHWVMGDCEVPEDYEMIYEFNYDNLLAAIMGLVQDLPPEYYWEFDTLRHPFVMHLRKLPETDGCELRLNRNLTYLTMTIDRSQLCTRVLPFGAGEGSDRITLSPLTGSMYLDSDTAGTWGYVSRTFTAGDAFDTITL